MATVIAAKLFINLSKAKLFGFAFFRTLHKKLDCLNQSKTILIEIKTLVEIKTLFLKSTAGYDKYPYQYISGKLPAKISFPGTFNLDFHSKSSQDLPNDLVMKFKLKKFEPITYDVPCFAGHGSW